MQLVALKRALITAFALVILSSLGASAQEGAEPFRAFIDPPAISVEVGSSVDLTFAVDSTAKQFNAFETTFEWDPAVLNLTVWEFGELMNPDGCSTFEQSAETDSSLSVAISLLCANVSLDGPGELVNMTFQTSVLGFSNVHVASDPDRTFLDAGLFVWPSHPTLPRQVVLEDGFVFVFDPAVAVPGTVPPSPELSVRVSPNPIGARAWLEVEGAGEGPMAITVYDVSGRALWTWGGRAGARVRWPGADRFGKKLPAGTYFYSVEAGDRATGGRAVIIR